MTSLNWDQNLQAVWQVSILQPLGCDCKGITATFQSLPLTGTKMAQAHLFYMII